MPEHAAIPFHEDIGGRVTPRGSHNPDSQGVISNERTIYDVYIGLQHLVSPRRKLKNLIHLLGIAPLGSSARDLTKKRSFCC